VFEGVVSAFTWVRLRLKTSVLSQDISLTTEA
jgi:hypothetical protein